MKTRAYFMDFELETESGTFFPRFETEILIEKALILLKDKIERGSHCNILDIGTGSGNISISLTKYIPSSTIVALDISDTALRAAAKNAKGYGVADRIKFIKSNIFDRLDDNYRGSFDLIVSNPPYISLKDFSELSGTVKNDPYIALYGGRDGLDFYREIIDKASNYLKKDGILLFEIGYDQRELVTKMLKEKTFQEIKVYKDYSNTDRIVSAKNG